MLRGAGVGVGMLGIPLLENKTVSWFLGFKDSWFLGFLVPEFLGFSASKIQNSFNSPNKCLAADGVLTCLQMALAPHRLPSNTPRLMLAIR